MSIVWGGIAPHPPIIVPEIGREDVKKVAATVQAMDKLAASLKASEAEAVVITTPHGAVFQDAVAVSLLPEISGSFANFGAPQVQFDLRTDQDLAAAIIHSCADVDVPAVGLGPADLRRYRALAQLDHGVLVPWYFLNRAGVDLPIVWVGMSLLPPDELYAFGVAVRQASSRLGRKVAFLASADLSHRLTPRAPAGYHPDGARFDELVVEKVRTGDFQGLMQIDPALAERAGECGWRSIMMLAGAVDGYKIEPQVFSYEGPFGVGYLVAELGPQVEQQGPGLLKGLRGKQQQAVGDRRAGESVYVRLARQSLETYVRTGQKMPLPADIPPELLEPAGAFVTLKKKGQLRGCIGTILPTQKNLAAEIRDNAVSAGSRDPRFWPVAQEELKDIVYSVDVLAPPEAVEGLAQLDPKRYGVIVHGWGGRTGLLLPNLEGIDTAEEQVEIAKQKAGLGSRDQVRLERFEVKRYY